MTGDAREPRLPPPRKRLGQHFLTDSRVLDRIADVLDIGRGDTVIEIGPGRGALTDRLADRAGRLITIEVDKLLMTATRTIDDKARWAAQARAMEILVRYDIAEIPLFRQSSIAAMKNDLKYETRQDGMFIVLHVKNLRPAN